MQDAKRRADALRAYLLRQADGWTFLPSDWEAEIIGELQAMQGCTIPRLPDAEMIERELRPNECHANARWREENDARGGTKAVAGWWLQGMEFVLHSVVSHDGALCCVTPSPPGEREIIFYNDPFIERTEHDGSLAAVRNGRTIGPGVRRFPAFTIARHELVRMRLKIGMAPDQAKMFSQKEIERLLARHLSPEERALVGAH